MNARGGPFAGRGGGEYSKGSMGRRWVTVAVAVACVAAACAKNPPVPQAEVDEVPLISAERLGDADAPEPALEHDSALEEARYLSPAEHEAMASQGYEPEIDDRIVTQTRIQPAASEQEGPKGPWGRAMDTMGRGFVAVASVLLPLAAAVAPFLLF